MIEGGEIPLIAGSDLPPAYRRDRGVYLARETQAQAHAAEPTRAAGSGKEALAIAAETESGRIVAELATSRFCFTTSGKT